MPGSDGADIAALAARLREMEGLVGLSPAPTRPAWDQTALRVAWGLFPSSRLARTKGGSVLLGLSDGGTLALILSGATEINGEALWQGAERFAILNAGAAFALFEFLAALWSDRRMLPQVGDVSRLPQVAPIHADIPRGLEHAFACGIAEAPPPIRPQDWLGPALDDLERSGRLPALRASLTRAMRMLWLHEIGHVLLGQGVVVGDGRGRAALTELGRLAGRNEPTPPIPDGGDERRRRLRHGIELQADRFAFDRIFAGTSRDDEAVALLGAVAPPTILHAVRHLPGRPDVIDEHPPVWFRAKEAMIAQGRKGSAVATAALLSQLATLHPVYGDWFGGIAEGAYDAAHARVEADALAALAPHADRQRAAILEIAPRPNGQAPLDLMS